MLERYKQWRKDRRRQAALRAYADQGATSRYKERQRGSAERAGSSPVIQEQMDRQKK